MSAGSGMCDNVATAIVVAATIPTRPLFEVRTRMTNVEPSDPERATAFLLGQAAPHAGTPASGPKEEIRWA